MSIIILYFILNTDDGKFHGKNDAKCDRSILSSECHIICYVLGGFGSCSNRNDLMACG